MASADSVLFNKDLWSSMGCLDRNSKRALRGVSKRMRSQVDTAVQMVASPGSGASANDLASALLRWPAVRDLTLLNVGSAASLAPLSTATLAALTSLTVRQAPHVAEPQPWSDRVDVRQFARVLHRVFVCVSCLVGIVLRRGSSVYAWWSLETPATSMADAVMAALYICGAGLARLLGVLHGRVPTVLNFETILASVLPPVISHLTAPVRDAGYWESTSAAVDMPLVETLVTAVLLLMGGCSSGLHDWDPPREPVDGWDMAALSGSVGATLRVLDLSGCIDLRSIDVARSCAQLRCLWVPGCVSLTDLTPLDACNNTLEELWLAGNLRVRSLTPLASCSRSSTFVAAMTCTIRWTACGRRARSWQHRRQLSLKASCTSCSQVARPTCRHARQSI